jgi:ketosteroid isomerase-like protein
MATLQEIERDLEKKNRLIERQFFDGQIKKAVEDFYTDDVRYLTPDLRLLRGHEQVTAFLKELRQTFEAVSLTPMETYSGLAARELVFQFVNATIKPANGEEEENIHYVAAFRRVGADWLCEMEVPAFGKITAAESG